MYKKRLILYMHKVYNNTTVNQSSDLFEKNINCYSLRETKNFKIPRVKTDNARNSTRLRGSVIWNSLEESWQNLSYIQLKKKAATETNNINKIDFKKGNL